MTNGITAARTFTYLPRLVATAIVCWGLGTNTYFDSANTSSPVLWRSVSASSAENAGPNGVPAAMQVLSAGDAELYKGIFAAQAQSNWAEADRLIAKLDDRQLMGHVLADRYRRRPATLAELQAWLGNYADLPEADRLYGQAKALAGGKANIPLPAVASRWSGGDNYGTSIDFRSAAADRRASTVARRLARLGAGRRRGNPLAAESRLQAGQRHHALTAREAADAEGLIAAGYFYKGQTASARRMADAGAKQQNPLALWIAGLSAWKENDAAGAGKAFALLAAQSNLSPGDRAAAQFWAWRALKRAGETKNANFWLDQAARQPHSFYGLMAAHLLGRDSSWSWQLPEMTNKYAVLLAGQKAGARALALLQADQRGLAESELRRLNPQGHRDLQEAMLALASSEHMPSLALQLGGVATKANGEPYDAALYPVPPWQPAEGGFTVDRALLYALMRHESQFNPRAVSGRGACGLMQLLPATARLMTVNDSNKIDAHDCSGRLLDPSVNMELGQKYVHHLADQPLVGGNLLLLLAAYNEGPGKLSEGLRDAAGHRAQRIASHRIYEKEDPLLFLESLPLHQTHDYIEQVLIHYWVYRARLDEPEASLTDLAHGKWPQIAPSEENRPLPKGTKEAAVPENGVKLASLLK